jgi:hypothetical protein
MTINLKDYANKLVVVTLRNEWMIVGLVNTNAGYNSYPYSIDGKNYSNDGRVLLWEENPYDIVDIKLVDEEPEMTITKPTSYDGIYTTAERETSKQWATALSGLIDELGGDSPFLWEWNEITPTPEKVVECLRELVDFHMTTAADNELEASCEWLEEQLCMPENARADVISKLRAARRPTPTLKSQALKDFETIKKNSDVLPEILETVEKALQSIPE